MGTIMVVGIIVLMQSIDKLWVWQCTTNPGDVISTGVANAEVGNLYLAVGLFFLLLSFAGICAMLRVQVQCPVSRIQCPVRSRSVRVELESIKISSSLAPPQTVLCNDRG
jgi:hypothetical protein